VAAMPPEQLAMLRDKPELIPDAVDELLHYVRLAPAIPVASHILRTVWPPRRRTSWRASC